MSALVVMGRPYDANGDQQHQSAVPSAIAALPHVAALVSDFLDCSISHFWTVVKACERNHLSLLQRLAMRAQLRSASAAADDAKKVTEASRGLVAAVLNDNLAIVMWLHAYCSLAYTSVAMEAASKTGKLRLLQYIAENFERADWSPKLADLAAGGGHLETLQWIWLHSRSSSFSDRNAMSAIEFAAFSGHLAVIEWLNGHQQWTDREEPKDRFACALLLAVRRGHLQVAKYVVEHGVSRLLVHASYSGNAEMVEWLTDMLSKQGVTTGR
ncbi:Alpha- and gamma-adaptin-binding protein p34 [Globisporangium polare]